MSEDDKKKRRKKGLPRSWNVYDYLLLIVLAVGVIILVTINLT